MIFLWAAGPLDHHTAREKNLYCLPSPFHMVKHQLHLTTVSGKDWGLQFSNEQTKAQRGGDTWLRSYSETSLEPMQKPSMGGWSQQKLKEKIDLQLMNDSDGRPL